MKEQKNNSWIGGLILIGIGALALVGQLAPNFFGEELGIYFVLALGLLFLVWGIAARNIGPLIPGGILSGIGLGIILVESVNLPEGMDDGGLFMLAFALGWGLITLLSAVVTAKTQWWPLIPGGIMALIGLAVLFGGAFMQMLQWMGFLWPVILIVLGLALIIGAQRTKDKSVKF
jgi:hypothetical protein